MSGYLRFNSTGIPALDALMGEIESAGDAYHHTGSWGDAEWDGGPSHIERIQKALDDAAAAFRAAAPDLAEAGQKLLDAINSLGMDPDEAAELVASAESGMRASLAKAGAR